MNIIVFNRFRTGRTIIIIKWILRGYTVTVWFQTHAAIESRTITIIIGYDSVCLDGVITGLAIVVIEPIYR